MHIVGKGNKYRVTPISQELIPKFERYCSSYHRSSGYEDFLFYTTRKGVRSQMSCDAAQAFMKKYGDMARSSDPEIPHLHPQMKRKAIDKISTTENSVFKEDEKFKYADNETVIRQLYGLI